MTNSQNSPIEPQTQLKNKRDLTGFISGRLTVIQRVGVDKHGNALWECQCTCGNLKTAAAVHLKSHDTKSCGCLDTGRTSQLRHGHARKNKESRTYTTWKNMIQRCTDSKHKNFSRYGGRGIAVSPEWYIFENFLNDMGERPQDHSLERTDNSKGYSKDNCKWATAKEQARNRRSSHNVTFNNQTHTVAEWSEITGINMAKLYARLTKLHWPIGKALGFES